jgi:mono/diheme cytochrome c family protein
LIQISEGACWSAILLATKRESCMPRYLICCVLAFAALSTPALAVELGNKNAGRAYAEQNCAGCHAIDNDADLIFADIPSFPDVANSEGMSPRALAVWLRTSHENMPDFIIPPDDMDNVIAYIMSLRTPKP